MNPAPLTFSIPKPFLEKENPHKVGGVQSLSENEQVLLDTLSYYQETPNILKQQQDDHLALKNDLALINKNHKKTNYIYGGITVVLSAVVITSLVVGLTPLIFASTAFMLGCILFGIRADLHFNHLKEDASSRLSQTKKLDEREKERFSSSIYDLSQHPLLPSSIKEALVWLFEKVMTDQGNTQMWHEIIYFMDKVSKEYKIKERMEKMQSSQTVLVERKN